MGEHVLVPFDGTPLSVDALERALEEHPDATVTAIYVVDPLMAVYDVETERLPVPSSWESRVTDRADDVVAEAEALAADADREIETVVEVGRPDRAIVDYAADADVDHIVMGSHGREGVARLLLGSVAEHVVRRAPVSVTVVR
ncbi:MAG: universal stress protein [Haloquadratum sp.]